MMTSKEWAIHKRLDDSNPMPSLDIPRGTGKGTAALFYLIKAMALYRNRPIYVQNPPIVILKGELING